MVSSTAVTPEDYLASLPDDRRKIISSVRDVILENLPVGFQEKMNWGMLSYEIPLETYPNTYNGQPLGTAGLAAQKHYNAIYLLAVYQDANALQQLLDSYAKMGIKPDIGKSCIRFKRLEQLPLAVIGELIRDVSVEGLIRIYEQARGIQPSV